MKAGDKTLKNVLKIVMICAGGVAITTGAILAVVYAGEISDKTKELKDAIVKRIKEKKEEKALEE